MNEHVRTKPAVHLLGAVLIAIALALTLGFAESANAEPDTIETQSVTYMPDVTSDMTKASYWAEKQQDPNAVLADRAQIDDLNYAGIMADNTHLQPLDSASGNYYDDQKQATLKNGAAAELQAMLDNLDSDPVYREGWTLIDENYTNAILANYPTDGVAPNIASPYAIVTTHTAMRA